MLAKARAKAAEIRELARFGRDPHQGVILCGVLMVGHATSGDCHMVDAAVLGQDRAAAPEDAAKHAVLVLRRATETHRISFAIRTLMKISLGFVREDCAILDR